MAKILRYSIQDFNTITFNGFNFVLPEETIKIISELSLQVGSPSYVKTPVFQKRENPLKQTPQSILNDSNYKKKKGNKNSEILNDDDWETLRTFQPTKIEQRTGLDVHVDIIRLQLNKMTDKNYIDARNKIVEVIDQIIVENIDNAEFIRVSTIIFEIASNNRFFSKMYADLYSDLIDKYQPMRSVFENSFNKFLELFITIEYINPEENYDKFCKINKDNEKRKALSVFFINLMINGIINKTQIINLLHNLLSQIYGFISIENKKNEVDELTENVALLYKKDLIDYDNQTEYLIEGFTISEIINKLAHSKVKTFSSLTNKSIFKFMDMIEM